MFFLMGFLVIYATIIAYLDECKINGRFSCDWRRYAIHAGTANQCGSVFKKGRQTVDTHRERIRVYLGLLYHGDAEKDDLIEFIFQEACRLKEFLQLLDLDSCLHCVLASKRDKSRCFGM
jgi:hypothetical protein